MPSYVITLLPLGAKADLTWGLLTRPGPSKYDRPERQREPLLDIAAPPTAMEAPAHPPGRPGLMLAMSIGGSAAPLRPRPRRLNSRGTRAASGRAGPNAFQNDAANREHAAGSGDGNPVVPSLPGVAFGPPEGEQHGLPLGGSAVYVHELNSK